MRCAVVLTIAGWLCCAGGAQGITRRALLVGISKYSEPAGIPAAWQPTGLRPAPVRGVFQARALPQLEGPVADVYSMRDLLVQSFDFKPPSASLSQRESDDVQILINENATAERILTLLKTHLIDKAKPGDISVFYFAGHGSRIRNERSEKPGRLDVTMVPADYALGVPAIRDKELARIYRQVPEGVSLTVIQDNCYSGGGARAASPVLRSRDLPDDARTVADPPDEENGRLLPYPDQQKNAVLILAASQPDQVALEMNMGAEAGYRGVFTYALVKTLRNAAMHERVDELFRKLRAYMGMERQEPVVSGKGRLEKDLFGQQAIAASSIHAIVRARSGVTVQLDGGIASGIREGCVLKRDRSESGGAESGGAAVRLRVKQTVELNSSVAEVVDGAGAERIQKGDRFLVEAFAAPPGPPFRVYLPARSFAAEELLRMAAAVRDEVVKAGAVWVEPKLAERPEEQVLPTHTLLWNGSTWQLFGGGAAMDLGAAVSGAAVLAKIANPRQARVLLQAPPANELLAKLGIGTGETAAIEVVRSAAAEAVYLLAGALRGGELVYFWWRTEKTGEQFPLLSTPVASGDPAVAEKLRADVRTLARVAGWLTLSAAGELDPPFPYRLALKRVGGDGRIAGKDVREGEEYKLYLRGERATLDALLQASDPKQGPVKRYIYVGITDSAGRGQLIFPEPGAGNQANRFPVVEQDPARGALLPEEIALTRNAADLKVTPPLGTDHYFLLVSATALSDPEVLSFEGAYRPVEAGQSRGGGAADALTQLLRGIGDTRSAQRVLNPATWSIEHLLIRSLSK